MTPKRLLTKIDHLTHNFTPNALEYLGKAGISKIKALYRDSTSNNWLMAEVREGYFIALANVEGCKSTVFGSKEHTLSIFYIAPTLVINQ